MKIRIFLLLAIALVALAACNTIAENVDLANLAAAAKGSESVAVVAVISIVSGPVADGAALHVIGSGVGGVASSVVAHAELDSAVSFWLVDLSRALTR